MYKRLRGENVSVDSPHTYTGAGGLVIRDDRLLVVKEHNIPFWKLPGGYVNPGEQRFSYIYIRFIFPPPPNFSLHIYEVIRIIKKKHTQNTNKR